MEINNKIIIKKKTAVQFYSVDKVQKIQETKISTTLTI